MNKSLEYVIENIKKGRISGILIPEEEERISIFPPYDFLNRFSDFEEAKPFKDSDFFIDGFYLGEKVKLSHSMVYDPTANFDYCSTASKDYDGTLLFLINTGLIVLENIFTGSSYCISNAPKDFLFERGKYKINYTIGDLIIFSNLNEGYKSPWEIFNSSALLPIKIEYELIKHGNNI